VSEVRVVGASRSCASGISVRLPHKKLILAVKASWVQFFAELVSFLFNANYFRVQNPSFHNRAYMSTQGVDVRYSSPFSMFDFEIEFRKFHRSANKLRVGIRKLFEVSEGCVIRPHFKRFAVLPPAILPTMPSGLVPAY
jgi:hypothetical protein